MILKVALSLSSSCLGRNPQCSFTYSTPLRGEGGRGRGEGGGDKQHEVMRGVRSSFSDPWPLFPFL